jgi:hypothetical protein
MYSESYWLDFLSSFFQPWHLKGKWQYKFLFSHLKELWKL